MSVNQQDRHRLAVALRALGTGKITNYEFDRAAVFRSTDAAVGAIVEHFWFFYDDLHEHRLRDSYALSPRDRRILARCLVFLETELEYEWPLHCFPIKTLLFAANLLSLGLVGAVHRRLEARRGFFEIWPFYRAGDLDEAIAALRPRQSAA